MKKTISLLCGISVMASMTGLASFAEAPVPVDIDKQAYAVLVKDKGGCDWNSDGIIEKSELERLPGLDLDLEGIKDISWLSMLTGCRYITFKGGTLTDFSVLKEMPKLREVSFDSVPLTDISFVKDIELFGCYLKNMDQITTEQRIKAARCPDLNIERGYSDIFGVYPIGLFGDSRISFKLDDDDLVDLLDRTYDNYHVQCGMYGKKEGTTKCHVFLDDEEKLSCNITVSPMDRITPELNDVKTEPSVYSSLYYGNHNVVIDNGVLYGIRGDQYYKAADNVKLFSTTYKKNADGDYVYIDLVLQNDGTLFLNNKAVEGIKFDTLANGCAVTADGTLYSIYPDDEEPVIVKAGENYRSLIETDRFYISESGEMIWYNIDYDTYGKLNVRSQKTGIVNPSKHIFSYFLDEKGVLWKVSGYSYFSKSKIASDVIDLGYYLTSEGYTDTVYITSDNKAYLAYNKKETEVFPTSTSEAEHSYLDNGCFYIHEYDSIYGNDSDLLINWYITDDSTLTIDLAGRHFAISDVEKVIDAEYVKYQEKGYAWFIRRDGSVWRYCFETNEAVKMSPMESMPEIVRYDVNLDGEFNVADVVTLQKWLLGAPDAKLADCDAADVYEDYEINVFDLFYMRKALIQKLERK